MSECPTLPFPDDGEAERWLPVVGWERFYEVSSIGRVRSLPRLSVNGRRWYGGKILKPWLTHGYEVVGLYRPGFHEHKQVHQLVAAAFIGPCPPGQQVRHGPNGKSDNRASHLCYGTSADNHADRLRDGTSNQGERHGLAKLTDVVVADCRIRHAAGETQSSLASEYGVSKAVMHHAIRGTRWAHVSESVPAKRVPAVKPPGPGKGWRAGQTHCSEGHEFTPENTYIRPPTKAKPNPRRDCKTCRGVRRNESAARVRARKQAASV